MIITRVTDHQRTKNYKTSGWALNTLKNLLANNKHPVANNKVGDWDAQGNMNRLYDSLRAGSLREWKPRRRGSDWTTRLESHKSFD
jgi:hypothetical protein